MAGTQNAISVDYESEALSRVISQLLQRTSDLSPAMAEISEYLHERPRHHFDNEQAPDGTPWAPLAESTKKARARKGIPVDKILHGQSLHLRDTIFPFYSRDEAGVSTGPGTDKYAATQQFGDDSRNIPARPFLGLGVEDEAEVLDILNDFLEGAL